MNYIQSGDMTHDVKFSVIISYYWKELMIPDFWRQIGDKLEPCDRIATESRQGYYGLFMHSFCPIMVPHDVFRSKFSCTTMQNPRNSSWASEWTKWTKMNFFQKLPRWVPNHLESVCIDIRRYPVKFQVSRTFRTTFRGCIKSVSNLISKQTQFGDKFATKWTACFG